MEMNTALVEEYTRLFSTMVIKPGNLPLVKQRVNSILVYKKRYEEVAKKIGMPWYLIGCIHSMEAGLSFTKHLHNGDPLTARTSHVPKGRPLEGNPPFTWEASALDALRLRKLDKVSNWSVARMLWELEGFNGYGYRLYHPQVKSPYLWSFTNHYTKGKYVADGRFDPNAVSQQIGAACLLKLLIEADQAKR